VAHNIQSLGINGLFPRRANGASSELNPLSSSKSFFVIDSSGTQRYLRYSSTWSFSWQIRRFLQEALGTDINVNLAPQQEGGDYLLASMNFNDGGPLDDDDVPLKDYAEYLMTTTIFHLGSIYHLFDKEEFLAKLTLFYEKGTPIVDGSNLWHVEFLLIMALGKLLLAREASKLGPPGAAEFLKAMKLLPSIANMYRERVLSTEILCCVSMYLHCVDMRSAAHNFVRVFLYFEIHTNDRERLARQKASLFRLVCIERLPQGFSIKAIANTDVDSGGLCT
jgi:proline utilization trans-activator